MIKWLSSKWWAPVNSYGPCFALTLWKLGRTKVELWYAPADYEPPEHSHDDSDGEFFVLYGKNRIIYRKVYHGRRFWPHCPPHWETEAYNLSDRKYFKWFSVRSRTPHAFSTGDTCMIWVVIEKYLPGRKVSSVASDFHLT